MLIINKKENCCGCRACENICPQNAIIMRKDNEGFLYPNIEKCLCINCGLCEKCCPNNTQKPNKSFETKAFACINKDNTKRINSSSGGMFIILAEYIINLGGVVFGAAFNSQLELLHSYAENFNDCKKFMGSKYLQSDINKTYYQVKKFLGEDRYVLFTGTPCQIYGLKNYLRIEYKNLLLVDLVCHGVPSPKVFKRYINEMENNNNSKITEAYFRKKNFGWKTFSMQLNFSNNIEYTNILNKDIFMKGFLKNLYLRPSCHNCKSNGLDRVSDLTLADYWGISTKHPEMDDDKGTSLLLINSEKGLKVFNKIEKYIKYIETDIESAIKCNPSIITSVKPNKNRDKFFSNYEKIGFSKAVNKYSKRNFLKWIISFIKRVKKKLFR
jgi:coenzyme F420-reducing hydrogenase beta subunit